MEYSEQEPIKRLSRDLKKAAATLTATEARYLVDSFYVMQQDRIRAGHQQRTLEKAGEPNQLVGWLFENTSVLERNIKTALGNYSQHTAVGKWAESIVGVGPIISAGLLAHIDMEPWRCQRVKPGPFFNPKTKKACTQKEPHGPECHRERIETVGHIWRFAGLDPTVVWKEKEKRPWNGDLKRLCWLIGESFMKQSGREADFYGKFYVERKAQELSRNFSGQFADQAKYSLADKTWKADTDALVWYSGRLTAAQAQTFYDTPQENRLGLAKKLAGEVGSGVAMLPPQRIQLRAQRWAVKLFLSHWHEGSYFHRYGVLPPKPYVIQHLGHAHFIQPPNMDLIPGWAEARAKAGI